MSDAALVQVNETRGVLTCTLNSPHNKNALSRQLMVELHDALASAASQSVRAVVLSAQGNVFCSGVDLEERRNPPPGKPPVSVAELIGAILACPRPVIAKVNGHARGGGVGIVAAADFAVALENATFAFSEVRVGVAPAVISVAALNVMTRRLAMRYMLTGEIFDAARAKESGLLSHLASDPDAMDAWIEEVCSGLKLSAPGALSVTKSLPSLVTGVSPTQALSLTAALSEPLFDSPEGQEGMAAFREKRKPSWVIE